MILEVRRCFYWFTQCSLKFVCNRNNILFYISVLRMQIALIRQRTSSTGNPRCNVNRFGKEYTQIITWEFEPISVYSSVSLADMSRGVSGLFTIMWRCTLLKLTWQNTDQREVFQVNFKTLRGLVTAVWVETFRNPSKDSIGSLPNGLRSRKPGLGGAVPSQPGVLVCVSGWLVGFVFLPRRWAIRLKPGESDSADHLPACLCDLNDNLSRNGTVAQASEGSSSDRDRRTISWCHLVAVSHHCIAACLLASCAQAVLLHRFQIARRKRSCPFLTPRKVSHHHVLLDSSPRPCAVPAPQVTFDGHSARCPVSRCCPLPPLGCSAEGLGAGQGRPQPRPEAFAPSAVTDRAHRLSMWLLMAMWVRPSVRESPLTLLSPTLFLHPRLERCTAIPGNVSDSPFSPRCWNAISNAAVPLRRTLISSRTFQLWKVRATRLGWQINYPGN